MKNKYMYILLPILILAAGISIFNKQTTDLADEREQLLMNLKKYVAMVSADYQFIRGEIPELADKTGEVLPLLSDDQFENAPLLEKYDFLKNMTNYLPEAEAGKGLFSFNERHIFETVILKTSAGYYRFSRTNRLLTVPSGQSFDEKDAKILFQIRIKVLSVTMTKINFDMVWGDPIHIELTGNQTVCLYNNDAEVTFINDKAVSILLKGIDTSAGVPLVRLKDNETL